jgi:hypothetical protein
MRLVSTVVSNGYHDRHQRDRCNEKLESNPFELLHDITSLFLDRFLVHVYDFEADNV